MKKKRDDIKMAYETLNKLAMDWNHLSEYTKEIISKLIVG
jgi:hypothetical protein